MSIRQAGNNLSKRVLRAMAPPSFQDHGMARKAYWANLFILITTGIISALLITIPFNKFPIETKITLAIADSVAFLGLVVAWILLQRRHILAASFTILSVFLAGLIYGNLIVYQTVRTPTVIGYFIAITMAGYMLGRRTMTVFVVLTCVALFTIFGLEWGGVLRPTFSDEVALNDLVAPMVAIGVYMVVLGSLIRDNEDRSRDEHRFALALAESNTDLVTAQIELQKRSDELEQRVAERTFELEQANEQLTTEKELAEFTTQAKSEFLAKMNYEIRTPMNDIIGMVSLLATTNVDNEQQILLDTIRQSSDTLMVILNDLLDISKVESGKLAIDQSPVIIRTIIEESFDQLAQKAEKAEKKVELSYCIEETTPVTVIGDALRLRQIMVILTSSAVKSTGMGRVHVNVDSTPISPNLCQLHFSITNTGSGINQMQTTQLFQPIGQADHSNTRRYGDTGLGLTICKLLCELMGGTIWIESQPEAVSTFHFTIAAPVPPERDQRPMPVNIPALENRKLLILEGQTKTRGFLCHYAEKWRMKVDAPTSVAEIHTVLQAQEDYDLLIIDSQLPELDSLELISSLRQQGHRRPIVLLASLNDKDISERVSQLGIQSVLYKPVNPQQLLVTLQMHLKNDVSVPSTELAPSTDQFIDTAYTTDYIVKAMNDTPPQQHPLRILLVEDNLVNQKVAQRMLERLGYVSDLVANGMEALHALHQYPYDVIFMDVQMPKMDGIVATRAIRQDETIAHRPYIIAITAVAMQMDRQKCLEAGMDDFLSKPAWLETLSQAIERYRAAQIVQSISVQMVDPNS